MTTQDGALQRGLVESLAKPNISLLAIKVGERTMYRFDLDMIHLSKRV